MGYDTNTIRSSESTKKDQGHAMNEEIVKISAASFYGEFHGHKISHLNKLLPLLRAENDQLIWTAGDSSLDNKYWFGDQRPAVGAYAQILEPPVSICDFTYWLNYLTEQRKLLPGGKKIGAINSAVEATQLNERCFRLKPQDAFLRDNIGKDDILIVSVGGNDIARRPTLCTIAAMTGLLCLPTSCVQGGCSYCALPVDDCCCGCGASFLSCTGACPPCLGYFRHVFHERVTKYIEKLVSKTKPRKILVCMIYYLDEKISPSWANTTLRATGYDANPAKLQSYIHKLYEIATSHIQIAGCPVIPIPLFHVLDGKTTSDYVARVEPSCTGGRKIAEFLLDAIEHSDEDSNVPLSKKTWIQKPSHETMVRKEVVDKI